MNPAQTNPLLERGMALNGKWEILEHIATGGKGEVYLARQTNLNRNVVVKTVSIQYLEEFGDDEMEVETEIQRFHREAMAMAQIRHPYVVQVYDQDADVVIRNGSEILVRYVVMEYVPGPTLRSTMPDAGFLKDEKAIRDWIRTYFLPILDGIEPIHELGIIHRDIKPENVLLDGAIPKITDFGIAGGLRWEKLTRSYHVEGTITYMAPEQFMDLGETDARGDIYALGKILYEIVQGRMLDSKTACPLKGVCLPNPATPFLKGLDLVIQESTAEDKELRTRSAGAMREALERLLDKAEAAERPLLKGLHRKQLYAVAAVVIVIAAISNLYHHFVMVGEMHEQPVVAVSHTPEKPPDHAATPGRVLLPDDVPVPSVFTGRDESTMHLVPAGSVTLPSYVGYGAGKQIEVSPFYLDETEVTNFRYAEFLNQVLSRIQVANGIVYGDGQPWLHLGPVYGEFEPIVYRSGRFSINDAASASYPVVKVTGYGAAAYAEFYGKRLSTEIEWLHAASRGRSPLKSHRATGDQRKEMDERLQAETEARRIEGAPSPGDGPSLIPYPVTRFAPDIDGIRGLSGNVSEWGLRPAMKGRKETQYVILGGLTGSVVREAILISGIAQEPSGAFEDVGFRCAMSIVHKEK